MNLARVYPWPWLAWVILFAVFEGVPLALGKPQYTLSEYIWRLEGLGPAWTFVRYLIAVLSLWLFLHLTFGWFR